MVHCRGNTSASCAACRSGNLAHPDRAQNCMAPLWSKRTETDPDITVVITIARELNEERQEHEANMDGSMDTAPGRYPSSPGGSRGSDDREAPSCVREGPLPCNAPCLSDRPSSLLGMNSSLGGGAMTESWGADSPVSKVRDYIDRLNLAVVRGETQHVVCGLRMEDLDVRPAGSHPHDRLRTAALRLEVAGTAAERRTAARALAEALAEVIACLLRFLIRVLILLLSRLLGRAAADDVPVWKPVPIEATPQIAPRGPNSAFPVTTHRGGHHRSTLGSVVLAA